MSLTNKASDILHISLYATLKGEHNEVDLMLKALKASGDSVDQARVRIVEKLRKELIAHAHAEQKTVYRALDEKSEKTSMVSEAEGEHNKMEHLVNKLCELQPDSAEWHETLDHLTEEVHHHVEEEEGEMFNEMHEVFSEEDEKRFVEDFRREKERQMEQV